MEKKIRSIEIIEPNYATKAELNIMQSSLDALHDAYTEESRLMRGEISWLVKELANVRKEKEKQDIKIKFLQARYNAIFAFTTVLGIVMSIAVIGLAWRI